MLAMVDVLATELAMANKTQAKGRLRRISWRSTATAAALTASRWAIKAQRAAAINLSAC